MNRLNVFRFKSRRIVFFFRGIFQDSNFFPGRTRKDNRIFRSSDFRSHSESIAGERFIQIFCFSNNPVSFLSLLLCAKEDARGEFGAVTRPRPTPDSGITEQKAVGVGWGLHRPHTTIGPFITWCWWIIWIPSCILENHLIHRENSLVRAVIYHFFPISLIKFRPFYLILQYHSSEISCHIHLRSILLYFWPFPLPPSLIARQVLMTANFQLHYKFVM